MVDCNQIIRATNNKLFTLKGRKLPDGSQQTFLMRLVEKYEKNECTEGWVMVISGNPLFPLKAGEEHPNKFELDKLQITCFQRNALLESSIILDDYVYLYGGKFSIRKCKHSANCRQHNLCLSKMLGDILNRFHVKIDHNQVVPFKLGLLNKVIMYDVMKTHKERSIEKQNGLSHAPEEQERNDENFIFWGNQYKSFVELKCPALHPAYFVEVYLLQRCIYKCKVKNSYRSRKETHILEHNMVYVRPSSKSNACASAQMDRVRFPLKQFYMPQPYNEPATKKNLRVKSVEYWGVARLLNHNISKEMTMAKLLERNYEKELNGGGTLLTAPHMYHNPTSPPTEETSSSATETTTLSSQSTAYGNCYIDASMLIMELKLFV